jgi:large subunit ribosomal protein L31
MIPRPLDYKLNTLIFLEHMIKIDLYKNNKSQLRLERTNLLLAAAKKNIHPSFYPEAKVFCNGALVMTVGGSQKEYTVDLWSGNHPYFQGASGSIVVDEGQVNRFKKRFAGLDRLSAVKTLNSEN